MSRSIGDGECKNFGVIPDPEIKKFTLAPAADDAGDGDRFVIVASDGVWEFITSQEAVEIVGAKTHATDACTDLVQEAIARWKRFEGSYRDDITAIVVFLPFLEADWDDEGGDDDGGAKDVETHDDNSVFINMGAPGLSRMATSELSPDLKRPNQPTAAAAEKGGGEGADDPERCISRARARAHCVTIAHTHTHTPRDCPCSQRRGLGWAGNGHQHRGADPSRWCPVAL